jgi:hypothetical protein
MPDHSSSFTSPPWFQRLRHACWWRELILRVIYFAVGCLAGDAGILTIRHTRGFDTSISRSHEIYITLVSGIVFLVVLEIFITHMEFRFPHKESFRLRTLISTFIREHLAVDDDDKARIALSLIKSDPHRNHIELTLSFNSYLKLLSAAIESTQTHWFATYLPPIAMWDHISDHSHRYFRLLEKRRLAKLRVVVAPKDELSRITNDSRILVETLRCGARLGRVPKDLGFSEVKDYALFDEELVISAVPLKQSRATGEINYTEVTPETTMLVRLLKEDSVDEYLTTRDRLLTWLKSNRNAVSKPADQRRRRGSAAPQAPRQPAL